MHLLNKTFRTQTKNIVIANSYHKSGVRRVRMTTLQMIGYNLIMGIVFFTYPCWFLTHLRQYSGVDKQEKE